MKTLISVLAGAAMTFAAGVAQAQYAWKPERPVTIIVPWAAGGSTDQMARIVASELEAELGQKFVVVNQPGASGSIGTKNAMEAAKDGYTWAAGAATDVGTYRVLGLLDTGLDDWHMFFAVANLSAISVNPNAPYKDFGELLTALKEKGQTIAVSTAGISSAGHNLMESIKSNAGIQYRHVTYDGGNPAVIAAVSGETPVVSQLLVEMTEMIKGKRLRPRHPGRPADQPGRVWRDPADHQVAAEDARSPQLLRYLGTQGNARRRGEDHGSGLEEQDRQVGRAAEVRPGPQRHVRPALGQEAKDGAFKMVRFTAWLYFDGGKGKVSPDTLGIPRL